MDSGSAFASVASAVNPNHPPYESGHIHVGDGHRLYFERYGTPAALPVLFVHGGPGAGFGDGDKALFDSQRFDVLLFDQRGAGRSTPFASLEANTTDHLVDDMTTLLDTAGVDRAILFGGSWGSTLALTFAIRHPERVAALVLRGIFLGSSEAIDHFIGGAVATVFPEVWERFIALVPNDQRGNPASFYLRQMRSDDGRVRERYTYEWAWYELSLIKLESSPAMVEAMLEEYSYRSLAPLEAHYMAHHCFLPDDYILNHAAALSVFPVSIVHGRYDVICSPHHAYALHRRIDGSRLRFECAGHSASEPAIRDALMAELDWIADTIKLPS